MSKLQVPMAAVLLSAGLLQTTHAQEAAAPADTGATGAQGLENIVVTARRQAERLQDVPVAVTAFDTEALEMRNVVDLHSLANIAPGLTITEANAPTTLIVTIRGLGNTNPNTGADASVGLYLNEVPINLQNGTNVGMFDLSNVQVLKGPQGTLFGRNTTGGAVLLTANRPTDEFEGRAKLGGTFFRAGEGVQGEGIINVPLGEQLAFRAGVSVVDRDGWVRNILPGDTPNASYGYGPLPGGRTDFKNELPLDSKAWRASLLWSPSDAVENLTIYDGSDVDSTGLPTYATALNPTGAVTAFSSFLGYPDPAVAYAALNDYKKKYWWSTMTVGDHPLDLETTTVSNTTTVQLSESLKLKNIFGYRRVRESYSQDIVGLGAAYFDYAIRNGGNNLSNELQLQGTAASERMDWVAGLFYFEEDRFSDSGPFNQFGGPAGSANGNFDSKSKSYSGFAQASYKMSDAWSATLGLRYTRDERDATLSRRTVDATGADAACLFAGLTLANCELVGDKSFDAVTYTASVEYRFDPQTLMYLATRRGYRSGGFSSTQSAAPTGELQPFDPEKVTDYELGFKRDWTFANDAQLRTNVAVFYQDYKDIQRLAVDPNDFTNQVIINVPKAKVPGGEIETVLVPTRGLTLSYSYAYIDPKYDEFIVAGIDNSDNTFSYAPKHTHTLAGSYEIPLEAALGRVVLNLDYMHRSKVFHEDQIQSTRGGTFPPDTIKVGAYGLLGANLTWSQILHSRFGIELFGSNLTNEKVLPNGSPTGYTTLGNGIGFYGLPPRMYGFNLRYEFGE